jgi:hypothetical protein
MNTRDHYTDELVSAYVDGELTEDERARVERLLSQGGPEQQWLEEIESLRAELQSLPAGRLGAEFTQRTIKAAQDSAINARPSGQSSAPTAAADSRTGWVGWVAGVAGLAATLLLAFSLIDWFQNPDAGPAVAKQPLIGPVEVDRDKVAVNKSAIDGPQQIDDSQREPNQGVAPSRPQSLATTEQPPPNRGDGPATAEPTADQPESGHQRDSLGPSHDPTQVASDDGAAGRADTADVGTVSGDKDSGDENDRQMVGTARPVASGQLLMVFDVTMTPRGREEGRFDRALLDQQIPFDATLTVDEELENTLMRSRFLEPAETAGKPDEFVQLVYVVTRGGKIDEIWQAMRESEQYFSQVKCDLAIMPADQAVFRELRRAADAEWAARDAADQNLIGTDLPANRTRAQQLVLPQTWKGVPAHRLGRMGLMPEWTRQAGGVQLPKPARPMAAPRPALAGQRIGENIVTEALFVITIKQQ